MRSLPRWSALAVALQMVLLASPAHSDPKPKSPQPRGPRGCTPTNVALFQAPTPSCGSTFQATVGTPFTLSVLASDADAGDAVDLAVTGLPAGAQLSTALPATGNPVSTDLSWTPAAGDTGSHVITFTAFDGCAAGPTQCSFTVNVSAAGAGECSPTNVALFQSPTPSCGSTYQASVAEKFTLSVLASDADGDSVVLGVIGLPAGAQLSTPLPATGNPASTDLTWIPAAGDTGSHVITFTAFDGCAAGPTQCSFTVNVSAGGAGECSPTNVALFQSPTPSCGSTRQATVGTPFTLSVLASDADGDSVVLGVIGLPAGAQLSTPLPATGNPASTELTWTPAAGDTGSHVITFTAFDGCAPGPTQCSFTVNVSAGGAGECSPTNVALFQSPTPSCGSVRQASVGTPFTLSVLASDADGDSVVLGVIGLPAGAQLSTPLPTTGNPASTELTWTPAAGDTGSHVITFTAFDGCAPGPTQCSFTVNVSAGGAGECSPTNVALFQSPTPSCGSSRQGAVGTPVTFTVLASDADGDSVVLGVIGLPVGAQLSTPLPTTGNPVSTNFIWTPAAGDTGSHVVTFTAFDGCAAGPTQCSFTIQVGGGGGGSNPPDCSAAFVANSEIWPPNGRMVPVHVQGIEDPDGDPFTIRVTSITQDEAVGDDGSCDGRVDEDGNGSVRAKRDGRGNGRVYHVTFVATDDNGASCEGSVVLCVPHDQGRHNECVDDGQNFHAQSACFADDDDGDDDDGDGDAAAGGDTQGKKKDDIDLKVTQVAAGVAKVEYTLATEAQISLSVYNVAGRRVATILEGRQPAGTGSAQWSPTNALPTVYFVQLRSGDKSVAKRIFFMNR